MSGSKWSDEILLRPRIDPQRVDAETSTYRILSIRLSLKTHAPLRRPGTLSTAGHCDRSSVAFAMVATVFENLEAGSDIEEIIEQFHVTREQVQAVLEFAARSLDAPPVLAGSTVSSDAHSL